MTRRIGRLCTFSNFKAQQAFEQKNEIPWSIAEDHLWVTRKSPCIYWQSSYTVELHTVCYHCPGLAPPGHSVDEGSNRGSAALRYFANSNAFMMPLDVCKFQRFYDDIAVLKLPVAVMTLQHVLLYPFNIFQLQGCTCTVLSIFSRGALAVHQVLILCIVFSIIMNGCSGIFPSHG